MLTGSLPNSTTRETSALKGTVHCSVRQSYVDSEFSVMV